MFRARGLVIVCHLLAALIVTRLRRAHRLASGAFGPFEARNLTDGQEEGHV